MTDDQMTLKDAINLARGRLDKLEERMPEMSVQQELLGIYVVGKVTGMIDAIDLELLDDAETL